MTKMSVVLVLLGIVSACSGLSFDFSGNVSESVTDNGWQYRRVDMAAWDTAIYKGANYLSVEATETSNQAEADIIVGACYLGYDVYPYAFVAYFNAQADWAYSITGGSTYATSANLSAAAGYIGSTYLYLEEVSPSGKVVAVQYLNGALEPSAYNGLSYSQSSLQGLSDPKYVTFTGTLGISSSFSIAFTFLASSVAGLISGGTAVGPMSFETVVQIQNWPYASTNNSLSLVMGVGTGKATVAASGNAIYTSAGSTQVYYYAGATATTGSSTTNVAVKVTGNSTGSITNGNFSAQLEAKYGASASYQIVTATFAAGSSDIIYDPSVGAGTPMNNTTSDAFRASISFFVVASLLLVVL